jgi:predicted transcriptional regulator
MNNLDLFRHDFVVSIKPEYALKIIEGCKTVELRRRFPAAV